jgi:diguanylate cyclase (GGDEF)-like protein
MDNKRQTILIIGEDRQDEDFLRSIYERDYRLVITKNALQAVEFAKVYLPDLILINSITNGLTKLEVCSRLSSDPLTCQIPVLVVADYQEIEENDGHNHNVLDYIVEPVHSEVARARIKNYLELKQYRDLVGKKVLIDPLTGIANRTFLEELLSREWRRAVRNRAPQSMIIADIDYFSAFNEHEGTEKGDECLHRIANTLVRCVKREVDCVARLENDEFACLLPETDINGASQVTLMIKDAIEELDIRHPASPVSDRITMSFGVATIKPSARITPTRLISHAEDLLDEAKKGGYDQIRMGQR